MLEELLRMTAREAKPTAKAKAHIEECVEAGRCLCCSNKSLKRGLCHQCYYLWRTTRADLPTNAKRVEYDMKLVRTGKILPSQEVRKYKRKSTAFARAAESVA